MPLFRESAALALPGIRHGFFGRAGGVSSGPYASLNVSDRGGDAPLLAAENRARAAGALGFAGGALATVTQVHGNRVRVVDSVDLGETPEADALVTARPGLVLGILTADCAPLLLADAEAGVIAAAHAGWKGAVMGIVEATIAAMAELGAEPARIRAAIGPTISLDNYEVGPDFAAEVSRLYPDAAARLVSTPGLREHFDLPGFVGDRLAGTGVGIVDDLRLCTYALPGEYFSHRRATHEGSVTGRQIALIGLG